MNPLMFLWLTLGVTAAAAAGQVMVRSRRERALRHLAAQWGMQFVPDDRFRVAQRVSGRLPVIGAADVRVWNLMYRTDGGRRGYLFTVEYGQGAIGPQRRRRCVALMRETAAAESAVDHSEFELEIAPAELPLEEQYRRLHQRQGKADG